MNSQPNSVRIDLSALAYNLRQVRRLVPEDTRIMGVVKSDAYGHGMAPVSKALEQEGIDCLGVAHLYEALELRRQGINTPIVIMCGIQTEDESRQVVENDLSPVLFDAAIAEMLNRESAGKGRCTPIYLKVDTGMGRLGISYLDMGPILQKMASFKNLDIKGLFSHLASADEHERDFTNHQIALFEKTIEAGRSLGLALPFNSIANSAGIMGYKDAHFGMVRPGIMLYGGLPAPEFEGPLLLRPVMHFKGHIIQVRELPGQTPVSYGRRYYTNRPSRIAILSAGYGDGLPRSMSNRGEVLIGGKRAPIVGTICMNLTMCDITAFKGAKQGDEAVFLGSQGRGTLTADDMAKWAGTISYEVFCSIGQQNKREYQ
jgi:alanine racemase